MRTIFVKQSQYDAIENYINAVQINQSLLVPGVDSRVQQLADELACALNKVLEETLSDYQYNTLKDAESDADEREDLDRIDMQVMSKYIDIRIR